jgi:DNA-binding LacI/PurR family transcriptional regulator
MANIKDVAKLAGVSVTTVSRVMNNTNYISSQTRENVEQAMKTLDYHPHQIARALSKKQTFILGAIIPDSSHPFFAQLLKSIEKKAEQDGYKVLLCNSLNNKEKEANYVQMLRENRVDGIIMGSHTLETSAYKDINRPLITFERYIDGIPHVSSDNYMGGQLATKHLIDQGCKKLLHISGPSRLDILSNRRADAFKLTCMDHNIDYTIIEYEYTKINFDYYQSYVQEVVAPYLSKIDGIFCSNDYVAYAIYLYCINHKISVPDQIKIIGYDYSLFAQVLQTPHLSTIAQPIELMGELLCESLIQLINKKEVYNQQLPVQLIKGETT